MKAIAMWQPWASLWLTNAKIHETRGNDFHHRGWVLVHATKKFVRDFDNDSFVDILDSEFGGHWGMDLPTGAIIGAVNVVSVHTTEYLARQWHDPHELCGIKPEHQDDYLCGNYEPRRYGIRRAPEVKKFANPIPYRGMQAVPFEVPYEIVQSELDNCAPIKAA